MAKGFEVDDVWKARGRGFQLGVIQPEGILIHLTGQVAWNPEEQIIGIGDVALQTRKCFDNIRFLLETVGGHLSDTFSLVTYFTDRRQLALIQKVRAEVFRADDAPASTSVMVAGLGHPDFLVELTATAAVPQCRFIPPG